MRILILLTLEGIVPGQSAVKESSFTNTLGSFSGGEFGKGNGIDIHGIWVGGGSRSR